MLEIKKNNNNLGRTVFGLLPNLYCEKKKIVLQDYAMYCNREVAGLGGRCIAIHLVRLEIVLQKGSVLQACRLRDCIAIHQGVLQVERGLGREKCIATRLNDLGHCIVIHSGVL